MVTRITRSHRKDQRGSLIRHKSNCTVRNFNATSCVMNIFKASRATEAGSKLKLGFSKEPKDHNFTPSEGL